MLDVEKAFDKPPQCDTCESTLTIEHILKNCPKYAKEGNIKSLALSKTFWSKNTKMRTE